MNRLLFIITLCPFWLNGQSIRNMESLMVITEGTILHVDEEFVNTGNVLNNGQLLVGGNWINAGLYRSEGSGTLELNGASYQIISDRSLIGHLRLTGGDKKLTSDLEVEKLELDGCVLTVADEQGLEVTDTITRNPEDYIIGRLIMTGSKLYPVGTINKFLPVYLDPITESPSPIGISATGSPLAGTYPASIAEVAPFHWVMDDSDDLFNIRLAFKNAASLIDSVGNALVVQSDSPGGNIINLYQGRVEGDLDSLSVSNGAASPLSMPYFSVGRKYSSDQNSSVKVYNLVSPNDDGINDFLFIENLSLYPENLISIYDRWGTLVYKQEGYDNGENVFRGKNNVLNKKELVEGTYYYVIRHKGKKLANGFFELTR